jgi:hypothetical protein
VPEVGRSPRSRQECCHPGCQPWCARAHSRLTRSGSGRLAPAPAAAAAVRRCVRGRLLSPVDRPRPRRAALRVQHAAVPYTCPSRPASVSLPRSDSLSADKLSAAGNFQRPRAGVSSLLHGVSRCWIGLRMWSVSFLRRWPGQTRAVPRTMALPVREGCPLAPW